MTRFDSIIISLGAVDSGSDLNDNDESSDGDGELCGTIRLQNID
jgi:hypothetical protein